MFDFCVSSNNWFRRLEEVMLRTDGWNYGLFRDLQRKSTGVERIGTDGLEKSFLVAGGWKNGYSEKEKVQIVWKK